MSKNTYFNDELIPSTIAISVELVRLLRRIIKKKM